MATDGYLPNGNASPMSYRHPASQTISPMSQGSNPFDSDVGTLGSERAAGMDATVGLLIRKLPAHTSRESLHHLLLFSKDFHGADFVPPDFPSLNDHGHRSAVARFRTTAAAEEVRAHLHGKQSNSNEQPLNVEFIRLSPGSGQGSWSNNPDTASQRANSNSSTASSNGQLRQPPRFNGNFQTMNPMASPGGAPGFSNGGPFSPTDLPNNMQSTVPFFSAQSPVAQTAGDRQRVTGKSVIREDGIEDEPADLLKDPVAYARNDMSSQLSRHPTNPQLPRFTHLSLNTNGATSPSLSGFGSRNPRAPAPIHSPTSILSPSTLVQNSPYQMPTQHHQRHNYPPVNPADQNPPINTLYVGNLPIDTSEDELKAMFSKQRGYKRLCFRTKQNGPMCFVEFEDVSSATKALNELYGHPLHNSVKGGIRLSFSKNPLGVRAGQPGGSQTPLSPSGPMPGRNGLGIAPFSTANGPPPGLATPPGFNSHRANMNGMMHPDMGSEYEYEYDMDMDMNMAMRSRQPMTTGWGGHSGQYSNYMYGR